MLTIKELVRMRKLLGITTEVIIAEMGASRPTVSKIELDQIKDGMATRFYRVTVLRLIDEIDLKKKEDLRIELENIAEYLKGKA